MDRPQRDFNVAEATLPPSPMELNAQQIGRPLVGGNLPGPEHERRDVTVGIVAAVRGESKISKANVIKSDSTIGASATERVLPIAGRLRRPSQGINLRLGRSGGEPETVADPVMGDADLGWKSVELSHEALFAGPKASAQQDRGQRSFWSVADRHERQRNPGPCSP